MFKLIPALVIVFLFASCGQNAFLKKAESFLNAVTDGEDVGILTVSSKKINFGNVLVGNKPWEKVKVENTGSTVLDSIQFGWDDNQTSSLDFTEDCKEELYPGDICYITFSFNSQEEELGDHKASFLIGLDEAIFSTIEVEGRAVDESETDGELLVSYLKDGYVDFGVVYTGSSYKKLVYIESVGRSAQQIISSHNSGLASISSTSEAMACSNTIDGPCFFAVELIPNSIGKKEETIKIKYAGLEDGLVKELELKVRYNAVNFEECFSFSESVHVAKDSSELNSYEMSLIYPYYDQRRNSKASLERVLNTAFTRQISVGELVHQFNENTQVFFSYNIQGGKERFQSAKLLLDLFKYEDIKTDSYNTEILCNLDYKVCSGKRFIERDFRKLINRKFQMRNDHFSKIIVNSPSKMIDGLKFYKTRDVFSLDEFLYLKERHLQKLTDEQGSISFVIADDVKNERSPILITTRRSQVYCN